jgi:hypothetical protein
MDLYRAGKIKPGPIATFDVSDIAQAYRYFNNKDRVGKVVISMENPKSVVQVRQHSKHRSNNIGEYIFYNHH